MAYTYHELKTKTVAELRHIASEIQHDAVKGYTQLNKEHLLAALCHALNIDMHEHRVVKTMDKSAVKAHIKELKKQRDEVLHDKDKLKAVRREIHELRRRLHRAAAAP
jgi:uncharacterized protein (UPF0216 family)